MTGGEIKYWHQKRVWLMQIASDRTGQTVDTNRQLAEALIQIRYPDRSPKIGAEFRETTCAALAESIKKGWQRHAPTGHRGKQFVDLVCNMLGDKLPIDMNELRQCLIGGSLAQLKNSVGDGDATHEFVVVRMRLENMPAVSEDVRRGVLDERRLYLTPDAALLWNNVKGSHAYTLYGQCQSALEEFLESKQWNSFCKTAGGVVAFGAGSASKDFAIIKSLMTRAKGDDRKTYAVVDYSSHMLYATAQELMTLFLKGEYRVFYENQLSFYLLDFMTLGSGDSLRNPHGPMAWFITGGTIGNLNEEEFFKSVSNQCKTGDWLMISMDTIDKESQDRESYLKEVKENYDQPYVRDFLRPALATVWPHLGNKNAIEDAVGKISVEFSHPEHSPKVPCSVPLICTTPAKDGQDMVLMVSTRYDVDSFEGFAGERGFKHVGTYESKLNSSFKMLVLEYDAEARPGTY